MAENDLDRRNIFITCSACYCIDLGNYIVNWQAQSTLLLAPQVDRCLRVVLETDGSMHLLPSQKAGDIRPMFVVPTRLRVVMSKTGVPQ
jgi:hypothetical protein